MGFVGVIKDVDDELLSVKGISRLGCYLVCLMMLNYYADYKLVFSRIEEVNGEW